MIKVRVEQKIILLLVSITGELHDILIAEVNNEVVSYANVHYLPYMMLNGYEAYISEIFTLEKYRGIGVGHALIEEIKNRAIEKKLFLNFIL